MIHQLYLKDHPIVKKENPKVEGGTKPKLRHFQQSTLTCQTTAKDPPAGLEDKFFEFGKKKHVAEFVNKCESIYMFVVLNYNHGGPKMAMVINNMEQSTINIPEIPEDTARRVDIFFWSNKYKEVKSN